MTSGFNAWAGTPEMAKNHLNTNRTSEVARKMAEQMEEFSHYYGPTEKTYTISNKEMMAVLQRYEKLESAIQEVLDDSESKEGGWGPDVTSRSILKEALSFDPLSQL